MNLLWVATLSSKSNKVRGMMAKRFGFGEYVYELDVDWGRLPEGWSYVDAVGMVVDSQDRVYVFNRGAHPIIVFDRHRLHAYSGLVN